MHNTSTIKENINHHIYINPVWFWILINGVK